MSSTAVGVKWYKKGVPFLKKEGWTLSYEGKPKSFELCGRLLKGSYPLRAESFWNTFPTLFENTGLINYLQELITLEEEGLSLGLQFDNGYWNHPWEAILQLIYEEKDEADRLTGKFESRFQSFRLVRTSKHTPPYSPRVFREPLRILILLGDDGKDENNYVPLRETTEAILAAWQGLTATAKNCISEPVIFEATTAANITGAIRDHRPHLLWYNGHGRGGKNPGIKLADKNWFSPSQLSQTLTDSGQPVSFCIFWACDTAESASKEPSQLDFPAFYQALLGNNILAFVGMQSPIRVSKASVLARETFAHLANGLSFSNAVSKARSHLFRNTYKKKSRQEAAYFDWASPVIWAAYPDVDEYQWDLTQQNHASKQWSMVEIIRILVEELGIEDIHHTNIPPMVPAHLFTPGINTWVNGSIDDKQHILGLGINLLRQISAEDSLPLVIDLGMLDPGRTGNTDALYIDAWLKDWAANIVSRATPGNLDAELLRQLKDIDNYPLRGFKNLLNQPKIKIILLRVNESPHEEVQNEWFWRIINESRGRIAVISNLENPQVDTAAWQIDHLEPVEEMEADIQKALEEEPLLCQVLAALDNPVDLYHLSQANICRKDIYTWPGLDRICLRLASGVQIYSSAKRYILARTGDEKKKTAHGFCYHIVSVSPPADIEAQYETLFYHSHEADLSEQLTFADELILNYRRRNRYLPILKLCQTLGFRKEDSLTEDAKLTVAWAFLMKGEAEMMEIRLERTHPVNPINVGFKYGLYAELYKSRGDNELALQSATDGLTFMESHRGTMPQEQEELIRRILDLRNDKARILHYLFYQYDEAIDEYRQQLTELQEQFPEDALAIATVKRNLSECLRDKYKELHTDDPALLTEADQHLEDALGLTRHFKGSFVFLELLYEKAKVEQHRPGADSNKYKELLEQCITLSASEHLLLNAIARNRYFWDFILLEAPERQVADLFAADSEIRQIQGDLTWFQGNGWAKRTLITSRIRTAKYCLDHGQASDAHVPCLHELEAARQIILSAPVLDRGRSDRVNIAQCWAGLTLCSDAVPDWQHLLQQFQWAAGWLSGRSGPAGPQDIWNTVQLNNF